MMTINETTTFAELLNFVREKNGTISEQAEDRLPTEKQLRESDLPVLISKTTITGAKITVYENGLLIYSEGAYSTVCTVERCATVEFPVTEDILPNGRYCKHNRKEVIDKAEVMGWSWYYPIIVVCGERLDQNTLERENSRIAYHTDGDGGDWYADDAEERGSQAVRRESRQLRAYNDEVADREYEEWMQEKLALIEEKKCLLTDRQRQVLELYYGLPDATEKKVAKILSKMEGSTITQQGVHRILKQALQKIRKNIGC